MASEKDKAPNWAETLELPKLRLYCARLEAVVDWYADPDNHRKQRQTLTERTAHGQVTRRGTWSPVEQDAGQRAREARGQDK